MGLRMSANSVVDVYFMYRDGSFPSSVLPLWFPCWRQSLSPSIRFEQLQPAEHSKQEPGAFLSLKSSSVSQHYLSSPILQPKLHLHVERRHHIAENPFLSIPLSYHHFLTPSEICTTASSLLQTYTTTSLEAFQDSIEIHSQLSSFD